jgi:hypothetical protein
MAAKKFKLAFCPAYLVIDCKLITFDIISFMAAV